MVAIQCNTFTHSEFQTQEVKLSAGNEYNITLHKKEKVARIHTGYSGPATGKYYDQFVKGFNDEIDLLLKQ